jgi:N-acetylmuramoyl-L-alanine amidase
MQFKKITSVDYLVVHCSASSPSMNVDIEEITRWHEQRGFLAIGYHWFIKRDGSLQAGRAEDEQGAHVLGYNHCSIGICLSGGLQEDKKTPEDNYTPAQYDTLVALLKRLRAAHPQATIQGHRDFPGVNKACPCYDVIPWALSVGLTKEIPSGKDET